jgi:hypothetical protein
MKDPPMLKLQNLKQHTLESWKDLSTFNGAVIQLENFKPDVQKFGDMRKKATWQKAYAAFVARNIFDSNSDNRTLITIQLNFEETRWDYELRNEILDQFLVIPEAMECIRNGLEQILGSPINHQEEEQAHGVFKLVQERTRGNRGHAIESTRRLETSPR